MIEYALVRKGGGLLTQPLYRLPSISMPPNLYQLLCQILPQLPLVFLSSRQGRQVLPGFRDISRFDSSASYG